MIGQVLILIIPVFLVYVALLYWSCHKDRWKR